ncbi:hypothetical protein [uncultured Jatrophihabitans sp.]|uniref:hypothetical protein n=1 Tax=uncultured Jatrophihabitans sp. TaxID=1610747 RepID=UPI0035CC6AFD
MSTYGTTFVIDVAPGSAYRPSNAVRASLVDGFRTRAADGWERVSVSVSEIEVVDDLLSGLAAAGTARLAVAEDNDEFGARWVVARASDGVVEVVHRRYILNADPESSDEVDVALEDLDGDPRDADIAGVPAATAAADTFGVAAPAVVDAEEESATAWEEIGIVGGPFPWWDALGLPWPVPAPADARPLDW